MIGWLYPAALIGLATLAGPIVVHLLRRQRAARLPFPSLRFVPASRTASVRLRLPSEPVLLAVRMAILGLAVAALTQPFVLTEARTAAWQNRVARAVIVDGSASMAAPAEAGREAAEAARQGAYWSTDVAASSLGTAIRAAVARLRAAPPARREIVIISDFQRQTLEERDVAAVPPATGLRFVTVGELPAERRVPGMTLLSVTPSRARAHALTLSGPSTAVTIGRTETTSAGLRVLVPQPRQAAVDAAVRAVADAGAPAPSASEPLAILLGGWRDAGNVRALSDGWMLRTVVGLATDPILRPLAEQAEGSPAVLDRPWTAVLRDRQGRPLVHAAASASELWLTAPFDPGSFEAAALIHAALVARHGTVARPELEIERIPDATLAGWSRPPGPVPESAWRLAGRSDARWFWAAALVLLTIEAVLRRERSLQRPGEVRRDAA